MAPSVGEDRAVAASSQRLRRSARKQIDSGPTVDPHRPQQRDRHNSVMEDSNAHEHIDTVSTNQRDETPEAAAAQDAPMGIRVGQDPSNLGDEVTEEGDLTHVAPTNEPLGRAPGM